MINECPVCENYRFIIEFDAPHPIPCLKCNWDDRYKLKEIDICLNCGKPWPCKSDYPCGERKALAKQ